MNWANYGTSRHIKSDRGAIRYIMSTNIQVQRICQFCREEFTARTTVTKYCSLKCASRAGKAKKRSEKIEKTNTQTRKIISTPAEELKLKAFLSISEASKLMGISRRTLYRMIQRGELIICKAGRRTILSRDNINMLFSPLQPSLPQQLVPFEEGKFEISDCYNLTDIQVKFNVSEKAVHEIIKRNKITKTKQGRFAYVPKHLIDKILK